MLTNLGLAALVGILGTFVAVAWTYLLKVAGLPGAAIVRAGTRYGKTWVVRSGIALTFLIDAFLVLTFAALVVRTIQAALASRPGLSPWPLWIVGWYLATAPVLFGGKHLPGAAARDASDTAFALALPMVGLAYWAFVRWPEVMDWGWSWVPTLRF
jgi:hypothetical protein